MGGKRVTGQKLIGVMLIGAVAALSGCAEREVIFAGKRENIYSPDPEKVGEAAAARYAEAEAKALANTSLAVRLPKARNLGSWPQFAAGADNNVGHLAFSGAPQVVFQTPIGKGSSRKNRITAEPIVADGRVYTVDSENVLAATSTGGAALWQADLTPPAERAHEGSGGGIASAGGMVYATTGFGELVAVNGASGAIAWRQDLGAPGASVPTVAGGTVYVLTKTNKAVAVNASTGRIVWQTPGTPAGPGVLGSSAPAVVGNTVYMPFSIGSLVGLSTKDGQPKFSTQIKNVRNGYAFNLVSEMTGAPVVSGSTIYVGTAAGATAAVTSAGQTRWVTEEGAVGPVTVAGGSIFMVGDALQLVRLNASTGKRIWAVDLPGYTKKERRRKEIFPSFGPTLAGGRLWVASGDGYMRAFSPHDGALISAVELPAGAASRPVIVGGVAYIVTEKGTLVGLR